MRKKRYPPFFFSLLQAGLWDKDVSVTPTGDVSVSDIHHFSMEQSVLGLVTAGLVHVSGIRVPKEEILLLIGETLQIEQRNRAMNVFISVLIDKLRKVGLNVLLVKGQGIAQCYAKPLWRACGDIDLLIDDNNYDKAKNYLISIADKEWSEVIERKHLEVTIEGWIVELHGSLRGNVLNRIDVGLTSIQKELFEKEKFRLWQDGATTVYLPAPNEDVILIFTHILQHFSQGGIGLRQICDWCRILWMFRDEIDRQLLAERLHNMRIMSEWRVFGALAVRYLNMPVEGMPFYSTSNQLKRKAHRLFSFILYTGDLGKNRDSKYYERYPYVISKTISLFRHMTDAAKHFFIFPLDSIQVLFRRIKLGIKDVIIGR